MKKIISILLAIVMCFTMTTVAFAAEEKEETPEVSKDGIISVLLEAAKIASGLNDEAREKMSEELEKLLIDQIAGDNAFLQGAAEWILDKVLGLSGADNLLDLDKEQAENIADLLMHMYDGNLADAIDSPILKIVISIVPEEFMKEAVVWILSDGFGDALQDFIDKYGDGEDKEEGGEAAKPETPEEEGGFNDEVLNNLDPITAVSAIFKAVSDVFAELMDMIAGLFGGATTTPAQ